MYLLIYLLLIFITAFTLKILCNFSFENSVVIGQISFICSLFLFYINNLLEIGIVITLGILLLSFSICFVSVVKRKAIFAEIKNVCGYSFFGYSIYLFFIYFITKNNVPFWGDELKYWASFPKILYKYHGMLQIDNGFQEFAVDYIPGISIYQYFLEYLNGTWSDSLLFFAYAAILGGLLLPISKKVDNCRGALALSAILYFLPLFFFHTKANDYAVVYQSLYVDPLVGVTAGMLMFICTKEPWENKENFAVFISLCIFITLLKSSGIIFVIITSITFITCVFVSRAFSSFNKIWIFSGLLFPFFIWGIWELSLNYYGIEKTLDYSVSNIYDSNYVSIFLKALLTDSVLTPWLTSLTKFFSFVTCFTILTFLIIPLHIILQRKSKSKNIRNIVLVILFMQTLVYTIGLYILCAGTFKGHLYSFPRYISTVLEMNLCFFCCELFFYWDEVKLFTLEHKKSITCRMFGVFYILIFITILPINPVDNTANTYPKYILEDRNALFSSFEKLTDTIPENSWKNVAIFFEEPNWGERSWDNWSKEWYGHLVNNVSYSCIDLGLKIATIAYYDNDIKIMKNNRDIICISREKINLESIDYICVCHGKYVEVPIYCWELYKIKKIEEEKNIYLELISEGKKEKKIIKYH